MFSLGGQKALRSPGDIVSILDVGSSKVCCMIGKVTETMGVHVIGIGHNVSAGVRSGQFINLQAAEEAVGQAVQAAESMAGHTVSSLIVNVSSIHCRSEEISAQTHISAGEVSYNDIRRLTALARQSEEPGKFELIHAIPFYFTVDKITGIRDPVGMKGRILKARIHTVSADYNTLQNIRLALANNHLEVETFCVGSYAASLSTLIDDEKELGCVLIDIGGGTTGIAIYVEGHMVHISSVPIGGHHVTNDIARGLTTPIHDAERLKTLHGTAMQSSRDLSDVIEVPQIGAEKSAEGEYFSKSVMTSIIQPRLEELFEMVRHRIELSGYENMIGRRVVVTGGGAQLSAVGDLATLILDKQVRIANPQGVTGLAEATQGPSYASACGLLIYGTQHLDQSANFVIPLLTPANMVSRVRQWLKENW